MSDEPIELLPSGEYKSGLFRRLDRAGEWDAAIAIRKQFLANLKATDWPKADRVQESWRRLAERFPLADAKLMAQLDDLTLKPADIEHTAEHVASYTAIRIAAAADWKVTEPLVELIKIVGARRKSVALDLSAQRLVQTMFSSPTPTIEALCEFWRTIETKEAAQLVIVLRRVLNTSQAGLWTSWRVRMEQRLG